MQLLIQPEILHFSQALERWSAEPLACGWFCESPGDGGAPGPIWIRHTYDGRISGVISEL